MQRFRGTRHCLANHGMLEPSTWLFAWKTSGISFIINSVKGAPKLIRIVLPSRNTQRVCGPNIIIMYMPKLICIGYRRRLSTLNDVHNSMYFLKPTYVWPWTAGWKEREEEEQEVAGNLLDNVQASQVPGHVDPKQLLTGCIGFLLQRKTRDEKVR